MSGRPQTFLERFRGFFQRIGWAIKGFFLRRKVRQLDSPLRSEAEEAVAKVIYQTNLAPDCVSAGEIRGGCGIKIKHDDAHEWFLHDSYGEAADKAIEWANLQGDEISTAKQSGMSRKERRMFASQVRRDKKKRQDLH